jgi:hypothetical protein
VVGRQKLEFRLPIFIFRYIQKKKQLKVTLWLTEKQQIEALVGKEAVTDKPYGDEGRKVFFLCSPENPVMLEVNNIYFI